MSKTAAMPCKCEDDEIAACSLCRASGRTPCLCHNTVQRAAVLASMEQNTKRRQKQVEKIRKAMEAVLATGKVPAFMSDVLMKNLLPRYESFGCPGLERASRDWTRIGKLADEGKFDEMLAALERT
jgi:hypothetical protein